MSFHYIIFFVFVFLISTSDCHRFHRLQLPASNSELQIVPRVEVPMSMAPTVQSGMNIRLPISLKFPPKEDHSSFYRKNSKHMTAENFFNETRVEGRARFYRIIEDAHPSFGKVCLLRSICEVAQVPLITPSAGLFGEIVDLLLTCSDLMDSRHVLREYREAEFFGRDHQKDYDACKAKFRECPLSIFKIVKLSSLFENEA